MNPINASKSDEVPSSMARQPYLSALLHAAARRLPLGTKNLRYPGSRAELAKLKRVLQMRGPASCQHPGSQGIMALGIY